MIGLWWKDFVPVPFIRLLQIYPSRSGGNPMMKAMHIRELSAIERLGFWMGVSRLKKNLSRTRLSRAGI